MSVAFALFWLTATVGATDPSSGGGLRALFPKAADVFVERAGIVRFAVPAEVLAECRPDLSDFRLFDRRGGELPFLLDGASAPIEWTRTVESRILELRREEIRRKDGPPLQRELFEITTPGAAPAGERWDLLVQTTRPEFVRRIQVRTISETGERIPLVENASIFRLPGVSHEQKTSLPLPDLTTERLEVALEGEDGFYLEPRFEFASRRILGAGREIAVPLEESSRSREQGRTIVELVRPRGIVPGALGMRTSTPWFSRMFRVSDQQREVPGALVGASTLFRLQPLGGISRLEVPVRPASGDHLRVEIQDGDSPPLESLSFFAVVEEPSIVFAAPEVVSADAPAATLLFGGGRAHAPEYDLAGPSPVSRLYDVLQMGRAWTGPVRPNPAFDSSPILAFAMRPGAELDPRPYTHRKALSIGPSAEGLSRLRLGPEELAIAREDLADVRVVDSASRQWPYVIEHDQAFQSVGLSIESKRRKASTSTYGLRAPVGRVTTGELLLEIDAAFVNRPFRLAGKIAGTDPVEERMLARGRLVREARERRPVAITFSPARVESFELSVEDGSEAPLAFREVRARVPVPELFVAAPAGEYFLLVGNGADEPPTYELSAIGRFVRELTAAPVRSASLRSNPEYSIRARLRTGGGAELLFFWIALGVAVVVLGAVTLRLAWRKAPAET